MNINLKKGILALSISLITTGSYAAGAGSYTAGTNAGADGTNSTSVGTNAACGNSSSNDVTCVGANSGGSTNASVVGASSSAGQNATVIGSNSTGNNNAVSIGYNNFITGGNIGIGNNIDLSSQSIFNSVFFSSVPGYIATYRSNEMNIGGRTIGGVVSATQDDQAVNFGQMNTAISTAIAGVSSGSGSSGGITQSELDTSASNTLNAAKTYTDQQTAQSVKQANSYTDGKFEEAKQYAYAAASLGMASSSIVFNPNLKRQVAIATANVNGSNAFVVGVALKSNDRAMFNMKAGLAGKGMSGVSAGMTLGF